MTTVDPRWTPETKMLVRRHIASACAAIATAPGTASPYDISIERAERLLSALADKGLLVEPGGETREEWSAEPSITPRYVTGPIESDREIVCPMRDPEQAMRDYLQGMRGQPALVRRTVHTGPWREAPSPEVRGRCDHFDRDLSTNGAVLCKLPVGHDGPHRFEFAGEQP